MESVMSWPLAIVIIVIIVIGIPVSVVLRRRRERAAAELALREHHRPRWAADPTTFVPEPPHWGLAVAAPFALCGESAWDELRYPDPESARSGLAEWWGVHSRADLLSTLYWLLTEGHRYPYQAQRSEWLAETPEQARQTERQLRQEAEHSADQAETLRRFQRVRAGERDIQSVDFTAWDLIRFAMLARSGVTVGYLSEAEARDCLLLVTDDLRAAYSGWAELGESFLRARWYWAAEAGDAERETDDHDRSRQEALLGPGGPWRVVSWAMEVPASRLLIVESLLVEGLIRPLERGIRDRATPWMLRLDDELRRRQGLTPA